MEKTTPIGGFVAGLRVVPTSVFALVLIGTYISIGALARDLGFSAPWVAAQTVLIWAAPNQVIMITSLGAAAGALETAIAVSLSGIRLMPMVVALLPLLRTPSTRARHLLLPAHFTAASMWMECLRLAPQVPREQRVAFANGLGVGFMTVAVAAGAIGFHLAGRLPALLTAALLILTPLSFLLAGIRNNPRFADRLALALGLVIAPALTWFSVDLDLLWTGLLGGTGAYALHRLREALR